MHYYSSACSIALPFPMYSGGKGQPLDEQVWQTFSFQIEDQSGLEGTGEAVMVPVPEEQPGARWCQCVSSRLCVQLAPECSASPGARIPSSQVVFSLPLPSSHLSGRGSLAALLALIEVMIKQVSTTEWKEPHC